MADRFMQKRSLEELERDITCTVCQDHYNEPKILPCLHYYCKKCILKLALRTATNQPFPCPECRKETTLPEGGVEKLKTAFFVYHLKNMYSFLEQVCGKVEVKCEGCMDCGNSAEAFCRRCAAFICKKCIKQHKKLKVFVSHVVDSLEDLKQGRVSKVVMQDPPTKNCFINEEPEVIFCFDCNRLMCCDCTVTTHKDYKFEFSKVAAPITKKKIISEINPLKEANASLSRAVEEIEIAKEKIKLQGKEVSSTIRTYFDELHKILEKRQRTLLNKVEKIVEEKVDKLLKQEKELSLAYVVVQSVIKYTEQFVSCCSDNEVMSMHIDISDQIKKEVEKYGKADQNKEPVDEADIGVELRCAEPLQQLCVTHAKIVKNHSIFKN